MRHATTNPGLSLQRAELLDHLLGSDSVGLWRWCAEGLEVDDVGAGHAWVEVGARVTIRSRAGVVRPLEYRACRLDLRVKRRPLGERLWMRAHVGARRGDVLRLLVVVMWTAYR